MAQATLSMRVDDTLKKISIASAMISVSPAQQQSLYS